MEELSILRPVKHSVWDFPGGPVVKNLPCNAEDTGSIPVEIPHVTEQLSQHAATTALESMHHNEDPTQPNKYIFKNTNLSPSSNCPCCHSSPSTTSLALFAVQLINPYFTSVFLITMWLFFPHSKGLVSMVIQEEICTKMFQLQPFTHFKSRLKLIEVKGQWRSYKGPAEAKTLQQRVSRKAGLLW